jgi:ribosomal protein S18 acetylase RimI-like enzyme
VIVTTDLLITQDIDARQRREAAEVFYAAFRPKIDNLELMPRSPDQAMRILAESFRLDMGFFAVRGRDVVAVCGMHTRAARFLDVRGETWRREFGRVGGLRRSLWYDLGYRFQRPAADELRIQGIAVSERERGQGLGTRLLDRVGDHARALGFRAIVLEVVDTNPDAQRLYERLGFAVTGQEHYGRWTAAGGFTGATSMRKEL